eukprot:SAG25_NODE_1822_length_2292_cov_1.974920_3_plen_74_part_00
MCAAAADDDDDLPLPLPWHRLAGNLVPEERQKKCVATVNLGSGGDEVKRPLWAGTAANRAMLGNARLSQAPES